MFSNGGDLKPDRQNKTCMSTVLLLVEVQTKYLRVLSHLRFDVQGIQPYDSKKVRMKAGICSCRANQHSCHSSLII